MFHVKHGSTRWLLGASPALPGHVALSFLGLELLKIISPPAMHVGFRMNFRVLASGIHDSSSRHILLAITLHLAIICALYSHCKPMVPLRPSQPEVSIKVLCHLVWLAVSMFHLKSKSSLELLLHETCYTSRRDRGAVRLFHVKWSNFTFNHNRSPLHCGKNHR